MGEHGETDLCATVATRRPGASETTPMCRARTRAAIPEDYGQRPVKQVALVNGDVGARLGGRGFRVGPLRSTAHGRPGAVWVDVSHEDPAVRGRFGRRSPVPFDAAVFGVDVTSAIVGLGSPVAVAVFEVEEHFGWLSDLDWGQPFVDPVEVVKQVSFLYAGDGIGASEFREHYRRHVDVARRHMPSLWQYVQNDVTSVTGAAADACAGIVAVSELWFARADDFVHRYFPSAEDEAAFRSHEGFLDLSRVFSLIAREWHAEEPG